MTDPTPKVVLDYLARLDATLADVQPDVRSDILGGIREELTALEPAAAAARISEMGTPESIAAETRAAMPPSRPAEPPTGRTTAVIAALLLVVGTFIVPVIGPLVGLVWISLSPVWSRGEKFAAWLIPVGSGLVIIGSAAVAMSIGQQASADSINPLMPFGAVLGWHLAIVIPYFVLPIEGVVLLVRAQRRGWVHR